MGVSNGEIHPRNNKLPRVTVMVALGCTFINTNYPFHIIQLSVVFFQKRGC